MWEHGFFLTRVFPYKDWIYHFVFMQENMGLPKPIFSKWEYIVEI